MIKIGTLRTLIVRVSTNYQKLVQTKISQLNHVALIFTPNPSVTNFCSHLMCHLQSTKFANFVRWKELFNCVWPCLTTFVIVSVDSVRVRSGAGRGNGEPLRQRTTAGRRVSQPIRGHQSRFRRDASGLGKFAASGAVGRGGSFRSGRGSPAAAVQTHLGGQLPSETPVEKGDSSPLWKSSKSPRRLSKPTRSLSDFRGFEKRRC